MEIGEMVCWQERDGRGIKTVARIIDVGLFHKNFWLKGRKRKPCLVHESRLEKYEGKVIRFDKNQGTFVEKEV